MNLNSVLGLNDKFKKSLNKLVLDLFIKYYLFLVLCCNMAHACLQVGDLDRAMESLNLAANLFAPMYSHSDELRRKAEAIQHSLGAKVILF